MDCSATSSQLRYRVFEVDQDGKERDTEKEFTISLQESNDVLSKRVYGYQVVENQINGRYGIVCVMMQKVYGFDQVPNGFSLTWKQEWEEGIIRWKYPAWVIKRVK